MTSIDSSKPAVAFLIDRWDPKRGGAERAMVWFARFLAGRGYRVIAVAEQHSPRSPGETVTVSASGWTRAQRERRLARALVAAARERGADITVGARHLYECDLYWPHGGAHRSTLSAYRKAQRVPAWVPVHPRHRQFVAFERELLERGGARRVACVSKLVREELEREWPACRARLAMAENGVDLEAFHPRQRETIGAELRAELGIPKEGLLLGFIARNWVLKGLKPLSKAVRLVYGDAPEPWRILAAGWVPPPAVQRSLPNRMLWRDEVFAPALMAAADVCVHPTYRDTSGLVILEALASGTPVITTRAAGAAEYVDEASGTVIEDADDVAALTVAIETWLKRVRAGEVDRETIRKRVEHLDLERCHETLERLVLELASR